MHFESLIAALGAALLSTAALAQESTAPTAPAPTAETQVPATGPVPEGNPPEAPADTADAPADAAGPADAAAEPADARNATTDPRLLKPPELTADNTWYLDLSSGGRVAIQLRPDLAPGHVERIKALTRRGFYNNLVFHRVIEDFMAQGGDPKGTGEGGSDLPDLKAEFNWLPHVRGTASMARTAEPDSANSQFFLMLSPRLTLDNKYTVFGRVVSGMQYVDAIHRGEPPADPTRILQASIGSDSVSPPAFPPPAPAPAAPAEAPATPQ